MGIRIVHGVNNYFDDMGAKLSCNFCRICKQIEFEDTTSICQLWGILQGILQSHNIKNYKDSF